MPIEPNAGEVDKIASTYFNLHNNPARYEDVPADKIPKPKTKQEPEIVDVTQPVITIEPTKK